MECNEANGFGTTWAPPALGRIWKHCARLTPEAVSQILRCRSEVPCSNSTLLPFHNHFNHNLILLDHLLRPQIEALRRRLRDSAMPLTNEDWSSGCPKDVELRVDRRKGDAINRPLSTKARKSTQLLTVTSIQTLSQQKFGI